MRFLLVETWRTSLYAQPFFDRLRELGHEVHAFKELEFFRPPRVLPASAARRWVNAQQKLKLGPRNLRLNVELVRAAARIRPDVAFLFRGDQIWPSSILRLKMAGCRVVGWQNDNPFAARYPRYFWRHFRRGLRHYDLLYAYRPANVAHFLSHGCPRVELLRSFYSRELHHPSDDRRFECDATFVGHWEPDGREECVRRLLARTDLRFVVRGPLWERSGVAALIRERQGLIPGPAVGPDYARALNSTKVAIVFLSKLNEDTYTRRCFEIPACGAFMLSEYSDDLASLFEPGVEAEYFRSAEECVDKTRFYVEHDTARERIARAGHARLVRDGHEARDRALQVARDCTALVGAQPSGVAQPFE